MQKIATEAIVHGVATSSENDIIMLKAVKEAASSSAANTLLKGFSKTTAERIGKATAEAAVKALAETSTTEAAVSAAKAAAKSAAKEVVDASLKAVGKFITESGWKVTGKIAGKLGEDVIPFLNAGFAVWDTVEGIKAGKELAAGESYSETK